MSRQGSIDAEVGGNHKNARAKGGMTLAPKSIERQWTVTGV